MGNNQFDVLFFALPNGKEPAKEFILGLDKKMRTRVLRTIELLCNNGTELREPHSKPLGDGIFELRAKTGSDISRVLYFFVIGRKVILTNGFIKKTQKTPKAEIERAKEYRKEYLSRNGG